MNNEYLNKCWKHFVEETLERLYAHKTQHGWKSWVNVPCDLDVKSRMQEFCNQYAWNLVYVDCRSVTRLEAIAIRGLEIDDDEDEDDVKCNISAARNLYIIDHFTEIPDTPERESICNVLISSWKNCESANVILFSCNESDYNSAAYLKSYRYDLANIYLQSAIK